jgi:HEAT repeat protein
VIALTVAGLLAPRWWPDGVVAYSSSFSQIIEAEARRRQPQPPLVRGPNVTFTSRVDRAQAAAVPALVMALTDTRTALHQVAIDGLGQLTLHAYNDRAALNQLARQSSHPLPTVRAAVIDVLGRANSHRPEIMAAARDADVRVRSVAMTALGHTNDPAVVPLLQTAAFFDRSRDVRRKAVDALCEMPCREVVPVLLAVMERNGRGDVDRAGTALLRRSGVTSEEREQVVRLLIAALRADHVSWNGLEAEDLLSGLADAEITALLREALADTDRQCRQAAAALLRAREDDPTDLLIAVTLESLRADAHEHSLFGAYASPARSAVRWLVTHPGSGTEALRTLVEQGDVQQRFYAAWLLGMRSDQPSAERICAILIPHLRSDGAYSTAVWAIRALYRLGPIARPAVEAARPTADSQQAACLDLLLRDWTDPPHSRAEAARRGRVPI